MSCADLAQDIIVSLPFEESIADASMTVIGCIVERSPLTVILSVDISTILEKQNAGIEATALAS